MTYLRDYQIEVRDSALHELNNGSQSTLFVMPTGTGKTETLLDIIANWPQGDVIILAHRRELILQPWERWHRKTGDYAEIEMGDQKRSNHKLRSRVTCASKDSLCRVKRLKRAFPDPKSVGLLIIDEAHHAVRKNQTYQRIIDYFSVNPDFRMIGCTATTDRSDEEALGQTFDSVCYNYPLHDPDGGPSAIGDGWLCPIEQQFITVDGLEFTNVNTGKNGDFVQYQLEREMNREKVLHRMTAPTLDIAGDRKTMMFAAGVSHGCRMTEILNREKPNSAYCLVSKVNPEDNFGFVVNSRDNEARRHMLRQFDRGEFQFAVNVGCLTEGYDCPSIEVIGCGRPTKSRMLAAQMAGRGTRVLPNVIEGDGWRLDTPEKRKAAIANSAKPKILILDFVGNSRHSLSSVTDVLGGVYSDEVVQRAKEIGESSEEANRPTELLKKAEQELETERKRREMIKSKATYHCKEVSPFGALGVTPRREPGWHRGRLATPKQKSALMRFKVESGLVDRMSFWQANQLLDNLIGRIKEKKCTYKQAKLLAKYGENTDVGFSEASAAIDRIAKNGWRSVV